MKMGTCCTLPFRWLVLWKWGGQYENGKKMKIDDKDKEGKDGD